MNTAIIKIILAIMLTVIVIVSYIAYSYESPKSFNGYEPISELGIWAKDCKSPCYFPSSYKNGGSIKEFLNAALIASDRNLTVIINTDVCISACTIFIDEMQHAEKNICVAEGTKLGFHKAYTANKDGSNKVFYEYDYRNKILGYHLRHIGLDPNGAVKFVNAIDSSWFFPVCNENIETKSISPGLAWR